MATVVVRSDLNKGGTWAGATESLKHRWTRTYVWDNRQYPGNQKLIELGAIPLSDDGKPVAWEDNLPLTSMATANVAPTLQQISLFEQGTV